MSVNKGLGLGECLARCNAGAQVCQVRDHGVKAARVACGFASVVLVDAGEDGRVQALRRTVPAGQCSAQVQIVDV